MKILVTGGSGFIGTNYIHHVLAIKNDVSVLNLDKLTYAGNRLNHKMFESDSRYRFVEGDICDEAVVDSCVREVDVIVHFAAESHVDRSIAQPSIFLHTNVLGTQTLLDAAVRHGGKRFHHVSTDEVYGSLSNNPEQKFSEVTPYDPRSPYSASKAASDHLVRAYYHTHGLPVTISNCSNNYGPYQYPEKFLPLFITNLLEGKKLPVYGTGENIRDWIHVEDHIRGIGAVLERGKIGETYCFGGDAEMKNLDIAKMIVSEFGVQDDVIEYVADRKGHDFRYAIDFSKAQRELGWQPQQTFDSGLRGVIAWYRENENWWKPLKYGN